MLNIRITRYRRPLTAKWEGTVEPKSREWIAFVDSENRAIFFDRRDPDTGAVLPLDG